ncbi:MAG: type 1 glutamine amidotransferase domain-containing protein, partial [Gammaproteobacteria bacterium]|nr:type 1 glutamine amidotransferase domain-containing protein [Gammaproteobacteria bacterium]
PRLLVGIGLHPHYEIPAMDLGGRHALVITTSHATLGDSGKRTGVWASEMTVPYYAFMDAGMDVDIASIQGGPIPIEPQSLRWPVASPADRRFLRDAAARSKVERSLAVEDVDASSYDIVFLAGGWGAAYDLGQSVTLGGKVSEAYASNAIVGGVCHGPLGLLQAMTPTGEPLVRGRRIAAVTDKQIEELGITFTPMHPERDLQRRRRPVRGREPVPRHVREPRGRRWPSGDRPEPELRCRNGTPDDGGTAKFKPMMAR